MTQARRNLLWVIGILVMCAIVPRLLSRTPSAPEPTVTPATPRPVELSAEASALKEIRAGYDRMEAAYEARNSQVYMTVLAPEYTCVSRDGSVAVRARMEESISVNLVFCASATLHVRVLHAAVQGHSAQVKEEQTLKDTVTGIDGKAHTLLTKVVFEDTWTLTGQGWKLARQKVVSGTSKIEGKSPERPAPTH